ncbi:MAG TPA: response regulator, partial [Thermoanaerobaculia bacterium]|nr:response regulator [Thermoanaerobaculia bacterium]
GEIRLASVPGEGSTFTLFLPQVYVAPTAVRAAEPAGTDRVAAVRSDAGTTSVAAPLEFFLPGEIADDRAALGPEDRVLLVIDNDESFARFLMDMAHENGFKAIIATQGAEGIALARRHRIDAITLDIRLPVIDGWRVLDRLKNDLETRHIPVYLITTEEDADRGLSQGAIGALVKPVKEKETLDRVFASIRGHLDRREKDLLLLAPGEGEATGLAESLAPAGIPVRNVPTLAEALGALAERRFDCFVVDASADGAFQGMDEIVRLCGTRQTPVLFFTPRDLSESEEADYQRLSRLATVRRVSSPDRLADQAALFLHVPVAQLEEKTREMLARIYSNSVLSGKKVLIVDDDIRNIFAITSVLERQEMVVIPAETGKEAIDKLQVADGIDVVLMDIMMPGMDGYETMREIRKIDRLKALPIIAVTAKAMKGDREKTLQAGAWDYLAKPVDTEQMLSVLRAWLLR